MPAIDVQAYRASKPLRPYQEAAVSSVLAQLAAGKRTLLVAPTGAGKSRMSLEILERSAELSPGPGLVLVHTRTLRDQSLSTLPGYPVATLQSLVAPGRNGDARRAALARVRRVFVDEAHHPASDEWRPAMTMLSHAAFFGATATPARGDGRPLGDIFESLVPAAKYSELVSGGYLVPCDVAKPALNRKQQKKQRVTIDGVASYLSLAKRPDGSYRPGIYFGPTISDCTEASERFGAAGIRSAVICAETDTATRRRIFAAYSAGEYDMLCSPQALAEGFDSPRAEVCVLCRSASTPGTYIQMVGRVLRPCPGKERALLIDCTDAASVHGSPTQDRLYSLDGAAIQAAPEDDIEPKPKTEDELEREAWDKVEVSYQIVRDQLRARYYDLSSEATDKGYRPGWVFHRFSEDTGIQPPRVFAAKYRSVCQSCRKRVTLGEPILWQPGVAGKSVVHHRDCWFDSLTREQLDAAGLRSEAAE